MPKNPINRQNDIDELLPTPKYGISELNIDLSNLRAVHNFHEDIEVVDDVVIVAMECPMSFRVFEVSG